MDVVTCVITHAEVWHCRIAAEWCVYGSCLAVVSRIQKLIPSNDPKQPPPCSTRKYSDYDRLNTLITMPSFC